MINGMKRSAYYEDETIRLQIDELLKQNMKIECNLGTDSTLSDREEAENEQNKLFQQIKLLDNDFYESIVSMDKRK